MIQTTPSVTPEVDTHIAVAPVYKPGNYVFFLGGNDAEMQTIRTRLADSDYSVVDKSLGW
jgi:hypothetical protein